MTVAAIIQARIGSTRLRGKVLMPLPSGRNVLQEVLFKTGMISGIDTIVAAIPDTAENNEVAACVPDWVTIVRGPEHDVLARYTLAARCVDAKTIMRITSDCPLIDPIVCNRVLTTYYRCGGFATNDSPRTFPQGLDCEVFSREMLEAAHANATDPVDLEHVTPYLRRHYPICNVSMEGQDLSALRWTLDTQEDYDHICELIRVRMGQAA